MTEESLHLAVIDLFNIILPENCEFHHSPNENIAHVAWRRKLKAKGTKAGWPDIEIIYRGQSFFIELKYGKNKPSLNQVACHARLLRAGAPVAVCYTLPEVKQALISFNIKLRGVSL